MCCKFYLSLEGGEESGFRKVGPKEYKTRLIHVESRKKKNKRVVHCDEVPVSIESLNNCDAFILDAGLKIYDFRPANCNVWEKRAANDYVNQLKSERAKVEANIVVWGEAVTKCYFLPLMTPNLKAIK